MKHWECYECEYQHNGETPPPHCPVCGADGDQFIETNPSELDQYDKKLLNLLQWSFPVVERPFANLGAELGLDEAVIIGRVKRMKSSAIRQISAIFDSRSLGYKSTLVAMKFDPDRVDAGAAVINRHPGVSHNYRRNHAFNLWFTLTLHRSQSLESEVDRLKSESGAEKSLLLPTLRLFKIGVKLDVTGEQDAARQEEGPIISGIRSAQDLTRDEIAAVRVLQRDMPIVERPFQALAAKYGIPQDVLFAYAADFQKRGIMRRFSAVLRHRNAGFSANAMGVWIVPEEKLEDVGSLIARYASVSHCYQRPSYPPDWPYNLFSMVHGRTTGDCETVLGEISKKTGIENFTMLYSTKEYKKVRVKYFPDGFNPSN